MITVILLITEVIIALYIHDKVIRPFIGDFLVVILLYAFIKSLFKFPIKQTALAVLLFSFGVETLQYFHIVQLLGLGNSKLANIIIGNYFSWIDIFVYILGIAATLIIEFIIRRKCKSKVISNKKFDEISYCFI